MLTLIGSYVIVFLANLFGGGFATFGIGLALHALTLNLAVVFALIVLADTTSDTIYYCLGRFAPRTLRTRLFKGHQRAARRAAVVEAYFHEHGKSTIFLAKMSDVLAAPAVVIAGATKMQFRVYMLICIPTSMLKSALILFAGYLISRSTNLADSHFVIYGISGVFLMILFIVIARNFYTAINRTSK